MYKFRDMKKEYSKLLDIKKNNIIIITRVAAKKIVSQFEINFHKPVSIFRERHGTKFVPIFPNAWDAGLPSFAFTRWLTQYKEREHNKQVLKRVAPILKVQCSWKFIPNFSFS